MARPVMMGRTSQRHRAQAPAQKLWTPTDLGSDLVVWWDPNTGITMNGSTVSQWVDRVSGTAAMQSDAGLQPSMGTRNGQPRLLFNGGQHLAFDETNTPKSQQVSTYALSAYAAGNGSGAPFAFSVGTTDNASRLFLQEGDGTLAGALSGQDTRSGIQWTQLDRFAVFLVDNGLQTIRVDGTVGGTTSLTLGNDGSTTGFIGYWPPYGAKWSGDIGHIIAVKRVLSASDTAKLEGWESWADGKSGANLPSSHAYASRAPYTSDP